MVKTLLVQPSSPLRRPYIIQSLIDALEMCFDHGWHGAVWVRASPTPRSARDAVVTFSDVGRPKAKAASDMIWRFLYIGGPVCGCPCNKSPVILELGPLIFGNSNILSMQPPGGQTKKIFPIDIQPS